MHPLVHRLMELDAANPHVRAEYMEAEHGFKFNRWGSGALLGLKNVPGLIETIKTISRRRASHPARKGLVCCCPIA